MYAILMFVQNYMQTKVNDEVYKSLAKCLRTASTRHGGAFRHLASDQVLQLEFAPMINRIISPPLRPVCQDSSPMYTPSVTLIHFAIDRSTSR